MKRTLCVENLDQDVSADTLLTVFGSFGTIGGISIVVDQETGRSRGFGYVEMEDGGDLAIAALAGTELWGRQLVVTEATQSFNDLMSIHSGEREYE